jgi:hypothetical protein
VDTVESLCNFLIAGVLGALLGAAEILSRYKDKPLALFETGATWVYLGVNACASIAALFLIRAFAWDFGVSGSKQILTTQVIVAGFGSAALFRSSLFLVKVGDDTVGVGPNVVLMSLLNAADRSIDRRQATERLGIVGSTMRNFDFNTKHDDLVTACLAAAANVGADDALSLRDSVAALAGSQATDAGKSLTLGLLIVDVVGADVLAKAVESL